MIEIVRVLETGAPFGVTLAGSKLHDNPSGSGPEQARFTVLWNPFLGVRVTIKFATCPRETCTLELLTVIVYPGAAELTTVTETGAEAEAAWVASPL